MEAGEYPCVCKYDINSDSLGTETGKIMGPECEGSSSNVECTKSVQDLKYTLEEDGATEALSRKIMFSTIGPTPTPVEFVPGTPVGMGTSVVLWKPAHETKGRNIGYWSLINVYS